VLITPVSLLMPAAVGEREAENSGPKGAEDLARSFGSLLREKLEEINDLQHHADALVQEYMAGRIEDVHHVTLSLEKAHLSLQLAVQVRNKIIEAYQEISRMQF